MNEIEQILSNIDKDNDEKLFNDAGPESKKNDEIVKLIDSIAGSHEAEGEEERKTETQPVPEQPVAPEQPVPAVDDTAAVPPAENIGPFTLKGTKTWNTREPYLIRINPDALKGDTESLEKSFYFVEAPTSPEEIKQKIKQEIVAFLRRPADHITERYVSFINKIIISSVGSLSKAFKLDRETEKLFLFHAGPLTFYKYIRDMFYGKKYGYCYKYLPGNKASRYFPDEFIKEIVMKWFEENINSLDLPYDSIQKFEDIKKIVSSKYYYDLKIFNGRLEQLNEKLGVEKSISRGKLFQLKGVEWFGQLNIEIYRRFLGGTIFM